MSIGPFNNALMGAGYQVPMGAGTSLLLPSPTLIAVENLNNIAARGQNSAFTALSEAESQNGLRVDKSFFNPSGLPVVPASMVGKEVLLKGPDIPDSLNGVNALQAAQSVAGPAWREDNDDVMVKLTAIATGDEVRMVVTPMISEDGSVSYDPIRLIHHPGQIQMYVTTESRNFSIDARFIARTSEEATRNMMYLNLIRSWRMPYYGSGSAEEWPAKFGAPPDVLKFEGYGPGNLSSIPVVLQSYSLRYDNVVDYIPTEDGVPFPVIMDISLKLVESYSPAEFSKFNLIDYKKGILPRVDALAPPGGKGGPKMATLW